MNVGVVIFPGSNCDRDCINAAERLMGWRVQPLWHRDSLPQTKPGASGLDLIFVPGGFSHGDFLRAGALAALSPIMRDVALFAEAGGHVMGICNGFQVLCETGLLPGALLHNNDRRFHCEEVRLKVERTNTPFTAHCPSYLRLPIAHGEGHYYADDATLDKLEAEGRVLFRYVDATGEATAAANPNGSRRNIAGIINERGNVCGMMPHPERAMETLLGGVDGMNIFKSLESSLQSALA